MKQHLNKHQTLSPYNKVVRQAYDNILKATTKLLATIERDELRYTLQRKFRSENKFGIELHELVSPIIYLSLEYNDDETLSILFGVEQFKEPNEYSYITAKFIRLLYSFTAAERTSLNIENCINTDYIITSCSELYECIEDSGKNHTFKLIPYKPLVSKRKQILHVA